MSSSMCNTANHLRDPPHNQMYRGALKRLHTHDTRLHKHVTWSHTCDTRSHMYLTQGHACSWHMVTRICDTWAHMSDYGMSWKKPFISKPMILIISYSLERKKIENMRGSRTGRLLDHPRENQVSNTPWNKTKSNQQTRTSVIPVVRWIQRGDLEDGRLGRSYRGPDNPANLQGVMKIQGTRISRISATVAHHKNISWTSDVQNIRCLEPKV